MKGLLKWDLPKKQVGCPIQERWLKIEAWNYKRIPVARQVGWELVGVLEMEWQNAWDEVSGDNFDSAVCL
jgi:hypothetical protein